MKRSWSWVAVLVLVLGGLISCRPVPKITADEVMRRLREVEAKTVSRHALWEMDLQADIFQGTLVLEVWEQKPDRRRLEVMEASQADWQGTTAMMVGDQAWLYQPLSGRVTVGPVAKVRLPLVQDVLVWVEEIAAQTPPERVRVQGEEQIGDRPAYKLVYNLNPNTATVWVDKTRWVLLQIEYDHLSLGHGRLRMRSLELNPSLGEERFSLTPPPGPEVVRSGGETPQSVALEEARAAVSFPLLIPAELPQGTFLSQVFLIGTEVVTLLYEGEAPFTLVQCAKSLPMPPSPIATPVVVRGLEGALVVREDSQEVTLTWVENGVHFSIAGALTPGQALQIASSLQ